MSQKPHRWATPKAAQATTLSSAAVGIAVSLLGDWTAYFIGIALMVLATIVILGIYRSEIGRAAQVRKWDADLTLPAVTLAIMALMSAYAFSRVSGRTDTPIPTAEENATATAALLKQRPAETVSLLLDCSISGLPISAGPGETIHLVVANSAAMKENPAGLYDIHGQDGRQNIFPRRDILRRMLKSRDPVMFVQRCALSNHGTSNAINVSVPINFNFNNDPTITYEANVGPIDSGGTFTFYVINSCPTTVSGIFQSFATVKLAGHDEWLRVPINLKRRNPIDGIMMLMPAKEDPVGMRPCEALTPTPVAAK